MTFDPDELANEGIRGLSPYVPGKPVEELERELGISNIVKLASNENPMGPSEKVLDAVVAASRELTRYPDGAGFELKKRLATELKVDPAQITLGNGSNEVLELMARTFIQPGDEVIMSDHAFAVYPLVTQAAGGTIVSVPVRQWCQDLDAMVGAITGRTKMIFIANPNNPTGTWFSVGELKAFLMAVPEHILVVLDEAYLEYVSQENYPNGLQYLENQANLVITRTFSKIYGMAALRIGYSVSSIEIAELLNRARQPFNVNSLAQAGALAALDDPDYVIASREMNSKGMQQIEQALDDMEIDYIASVGNFICVEVGDNADDIYQSLLKEGVIVRPVANYGMPRHLRVTIGTEPENIKFIEALKTVLAS